MKLFKNFKTKRQLKAELQIMQCLRKPQIHIVEHEYETISLVMDFDTNTPTEIIKEEIAYEMVKLLKPFINWEVKGCEDNPFKRQMRGNIYVIKKKQ